MNEVPFDPGSISEQESSPADIERFEEPDVKILDGESDRPAIIEVPNGGEINVEALGACLGVVGYDAGRKIIFGGHFLILAAEEDVNHLFHRLEENGINPTEVAIAGGNIDYEDKREIGEVEAAKVNSAKEKFIAAVRNRIPEDKLRNHVATVLAESTRSDALSVEYSDGEFRLRFQEGHIEEARSGLF